MSKEPNQQEIKKIVEGNNSFAFELYEKLKSEKGNLFLSPYSISTAFAMAYAGARGRTAEQMAEVLHFDLEEKYLHPVFAKLIAQTQAYSKKRGYQLNIANAIWGQKGYKFLKEFIKILEKNYRAGFNSLDFSSDPERARKIINNWVEEKTNKKIKELLLRGMIDKITRLVLTNAIYFKGDWKFKFDKEETKIAPFYVTAEKTINVPMMSIKGEFRYTETDDFQIIELPYADEKLSMIILLPKNINGLADLENELYRDNFSRLLGNLHPVKEVEVYLPKFKMTVRFELRKTLEAMGMEDAFSSAADFSGIDGTRGLSISAVVHKAFVDVNEEGTEAAAATAIVFKGMTEKIIFRADHPFLFVIKDNQTGSILFIGRLLQPEGYTLRS